jgi:hypothetical protein
VSHETIPVKPVHSPIEYPETATGEQRTAVENIATRYRARHVDVTDRAFDLPQGWLYVALLPLHGGEFHCGVSPEGHTHS